MKQVSVVTGAAGILGKAIIEELITIGTDVVIGIDITPYDIPLGWENKVYPCIMDITNQNSIDTILQPMIHKHGNPQILVNNAGILTNNKILETSLEEWTKVLSVNLTGAFLIAQTVIPGMKKLAWGRIINISSLAAKTGGITAGTAYSVSKGGMNSLTFSLAAELASHGITVNAIAPAYIETPMVTEQLTKEQQKRIVDSIPVKRFCKADEVAYMVGCLCSEKAGFITGEILDQNGGLYFD